MKLEQISLPVSNTLLDDYWSEQASIHSFFSYKFNERSFEERARYLNQKKYNRERLAEVIRSYMKRYGMSPQVEQHLQQLQEGAVAVVGGQQAGVLTGPLYSVYKAITVILLAKEQQEKLNIQVVPLFWVAGEDHDIEEVNHTYTIVDNSVKKRGYSERSKRKTMASTTELNKVAMEQFIRTVFKDYGETEHTASLYQNVLEHLEVSETFSEFFAALMNDLFSRHGLLMIDAAYEPFRQYESEFFQILIQHNEEISEGVVRQEQALAQAGYGTPIGAEVSNANLFFVKEGERFLLERKGDLYTNGLGYVKFTKEELLQVAKEAPMKLSNNVVTRPLMQEMTIPVLAFVGGPGELAYWATLKPAFEAIGLQMPIFAPRLNISIVTRQVETLLKQHQLTVEDAMKNKVERVKKEFINSIQDEQALQQVDKMNELLQQQYETLHAHLQQAGVSIDKTIDKNKVYHEMQFTYLKSKIQQSVTLKHETIISQFDLISAEIAPNEGFQERTFNPYQYLNRFGKNLIEDLLELPLKVSPTHYVVKY
ncbi:bacillithiol biosynthesis cysteine-adding enzyme BshC [Lysinibacillus sp. 54212]|uniref:bacillithiol biosynthesis cysteine-adding enzyme BshC n=1 Tax=Lysinibacillus sp. 54212 TaxID=3119829 RepID=UPI002FCB19A1